MIKYEYIVVGSNSEEHSLVAIDYDVREGFVIFQGGNPMDVLHSFYKPVHVLCLGEYIEKDS